MASQLLIRAKKIVTVSEQGTINDGVMCIEEGKIKWITSWSNIKRVAPSTQFSELIHFEESVITPSLVDCHTHLLEFAPSSLFPVTAETHLMEATHLLFHALSCGITALGEQICGHPNIHLTPETCRQLVHPLPLDVQFSFSSVSIGFNPLVHFSGITGSRPIGKEQLTEAALVEKLAQESDYPGENLFINATPANFTPDQVPLAGEVIYTTEELQKIAACFHRLGKKIGVHVAGAESIRSALEAGVDVLHHAHGITEELAEEAAQRGVAIVATPLGGTHVLPNSPEEVSLLVHLGITVALSTDAYLPPHPEATWFLPGQRGLQGPEVFMQIAQPFMLHLAEQGWDENDILALITANGAKILGKEGVYGRLKEGMEANFLVAKGIPGLEITAIADIHQVYYQGRKVVHRE